MVSSKVLSIDWDYFVDTSIDFKTSNFPDGGNENLPESILDAIWVTRYGQCDKMQGIKEDTKELVKLRMLLKRVANPYTRVIISDSHKDIYEPLEELRQSKFPMKTYNIDFHHDIYNFGDEEVNCGNWLRKFIDAEGASDLDKFMWIRRKDSELSGEEFIDDNSVVGIPEDLPDTFHLIFLCRSGVWSPPHLDDRFLSLYRFLNKNYNNIEVVNNSVLRNRYNKQFKANVTDYSNMMKRITGGGET